MLQDSDAKAELDAIVETIIYLYTESRRLTKGMAARSGLTGPQLTVIKLLETFGICRSRRCRSASARRTAR
jgi:hypothetical protein